MTYIGSDSPRLIISLIIIAPFIVALEHLVQTIVLTEVPAGGYRFPDLTSGLVAASAWDADAALFARRGEASVALKSKIVVFDPADDVLFFVTTGYTLVAFAYLSQKYAEADGKVAGFMKAQGYVLSDPRGLVMPCRASLAHRPRPPHALYVGRGERSEGLAPSCWGNPFRILGGVSRQGSVALYAKRLTRLDRLWHRLGELSGRSLLCRCAATQCCHADVLIAEFHRYRSEASEALFGAPPSDRAALGAADARRAAAAVPARRSLVDRRAPSVTLGSGPPLMVGTGAFRRVFADEGGGGGGAGLPGPLATGPAHRPLGPTRGPATRGSPQPPSPAPRPFQARPS